MEIIMKLGVCEFMHKTPKTFSVIINVSEPEKVTEIFVKEEKGLRAIGIKKLIEKLDRTEKYKHIGKGTGTGFDQTKPIFYATHERK